MDFIEQSGIDISGAILTLAIAMILHIFILRRLTVTIFDPVSYVAIFAVFSLAIIHTLASFNLEIYAWLSFAIFWLGVLLAAPKLGGQLAAQVFSEGLANAERELTLKLVVGFSAALLVGANALLWINSGVPALSDNPSLAKSELYEGGFGFVRRLNWALGVFALFGTLLLFLRRPGLLWAMVLVILLVILGLGGGKSSLLPAVFVLGLLIAHPHSSISRRRQRLGRKLLVGAVPLAIVAAMATLFTEAGDIDGALQKFIIRLFSFGDVMIYWSVDDIRREILSRYDSFSYLGHLLNPILGIFRLADYKIPLGNELVSYSLGVGQEIASALGPNIPFYITGDIFFGNIIGLLYSFVIGLVFGVIRKVFVQSSSQRPFSFCIAGTILILSSALPIQDDLFVGYIFDLFVPVCVIYALSLTLIRASTFARSTANTRFLPTEFATEQ
jgi:hypothetical protein